MEQILLLPHPRTSQIVELESKMFMVAVDYCQTTDSWLFSITNEKTGGTVRGIAMMPMRPLLYHHKVSVGIEGDIFAIPEGVIKNEAFTKEHIGWDAISQGWVGLYYIHSDEIEALSE